MNKVFIDSNIVLYLMDEDEQKRTIAAQILALRPLISPQVLTETANVCKRRFKYTKEQILNLWADLTNDCFLVPTDVTIFSDAIKLSKQYNFQVFDALIVASALKAGCKTLYSEDMQHKMLVEKSLTIINPFAQS